MQNGNYKSRGRNEPLADAAKLPRQPKMMARTGICQFSPEVNNNYDAGFGSAPMLVVATGAAAGTETPAEVAGTGTACRE